MTTVAERVQQVEATLLPFHDEGWREDLAALGESAREAARTFANDAERIARLATAVPPPGGERGATAWTSFVREVATARRVTDRAAATDVEIAVQLVGRMPQAMSLLHEGRLPVAQARTLAQETAHCDDAVVAQLDEELALRACGLATWRVREAVQKRLLSLDAAAAARRAARATADRDVRAYPLPDDQAGVTITGPALALTAWFQGIARQARALKAAGDPRSLSALRFDLAVSAGMPPGAAAAGGAEGGAAPTPGGSGVPASAPPGPGPAAPPSADDDEPSTEDDAPVDDDAPCPDVPSSTDDPLSAPSVDEAGPASPYQRPPSPGDLTGTPERYSDCRLRRPVQLLVHVPVATALGLSDEPGWLEGHGWISAPQVRQLLPVAELRQVCVTPDGQVVDLSDRAVRPPPTPQGAREALRRMASEPFDITDKTWRTQEQHDPSDALREFIAIRDRFCDGPTQSRSAAGTCELDHVRPWPEGPTAAWNLTARATRTHGLKHRGWDDVATSTGTLWISPAGQVVMTDRFADPPPAVDEAAQLPDPDELHVNDAELLRATDTGGYLIAPDDEAPPDDTKHDPPQQSVADDEPLPF